MQIFPTRMYNVTAWCHSRLLAHWLMTLVARGGGEFFSDCTVSYLSFGCGRSLWAELNGGGNSLHWKANMLPLFSIMTLWLGSSFIITPPLLPIVAGLSRRRLWGATAVSPPTNLAKWSTPPRWTAEVSSKPLQSVFKVYGRFEKDRIFSKYFKPPFYLYFLM